MKHGPLTKAEREAYAADAAKENKEAGDDLSSVSDGRSAPDDQGTDFARGEGNLEPGDVLGGIS